MKSAKKFKNKLYSEDLEIDLKKGGSAELFKWFLACLLFGKPIQQEIAKKTCIEFIKEGLITPEKIISAGWDRLVEILGRGHYVRFDFSTATKLIEISKSLKEKYGSLDNLLKSAENEGDLRKKLLEFKGVGPVTSEIFIRDLKRYGYL